MCEVGLTPTFRAVAPVAQHLVTILMAVGVGRCHQWLLMIYQHRCGCYESLRAPQVT